MLCFILLQTQWAKHYENLKTKLRPGHSDYPAMTKYNHYNDHRGGGRFSGRLTATHVMGGAIARKVLKVTLGIETNSFTSQIGKIKMEREFNEKITHNTHGPRGPMPPVSPLVVSPARQRWHERWPNQSKTRRGGSCGLRGPLKFRLKIGRHLTWRQTRDPRMCPHSVTRVRTCPRPVYSYDGLACDRRGASVAGKPGATAAVDAYRSSHPACQRGARRKSADPRRVRRRTRGAKRGAA